MINEIRRPAAILFLVFLSVFVFLCDPGDIGAQEPRLEIYFNEQRTIQQLCPWADPYHPGPDYPFTIYFVAVELDMWISAIEFSVSYPLRVTWLGDTYYSTLHIGTSPEGIAMAWNTPQDAYNPMLVMKADIIYHAVKYQDEIHIKALPAPFSGRLRAVRWPDNAEVDVEGGWVTFCEETIPVQKTTWGRIKSLYK